MDMESKKAYPLSHYRDTVISYLKEGGDYFKVIPSGFNDLDFIIGGFSKGSVSVIAASSNTGKTFFLLSLAKNVAKSGKKVLYLDLEKQASYNVLRVMSSEKGNNIYGEILKCRKKEQYTSLGEEVEGYSFDKDVYKNIYYVDCTRITLSEISELCVGGAYDIVILDYYQKMQSELDCDNTFEKFNTIGYMFRDLTVDNNIPLVLSSQINNYSEKKEPMMDEAKGANSIIEECNNSIFLRRERDDNGNPLNRLNFWVVKSKNGMQGKGSLYFDPVRGIVGNIDDRREEF